MIMSNLKGSLKQNTIKAQIDMNFVLSDFFGGNQG
jgi:hypothetical protein